jgi:hypothetical protein
MSKGSISKKKNPTPEKGIRNNEKEEEEYFYILHVYRSAYTITEFLTMNDTCFCPF